MNFSELKGKAQGLIRGCDFFVEASNDDVIVAYLNEDEFIRFVVNHLGSWMALKELEDGVFVFEVIELDVLDLSSYHRLTTVTNSVYPNFEHLIHFGDEEVLQWAKMQGVDCNALFDLQGVYNDRYVDFWMDQHPMYKADFVFAYGGGWAMIWPDDDRPMQWDERLEFVYQVGVQTEPFVEVYWNKVSQEFSCIVRYT